jgi:hypothetical protein
MVITPVGRRGQSATFNSNDERGGRFLPAAGFDLFGPIFYVPGRRQGDAHVFTNEALAIDGVGSRSTEIDRLTREGCDRWLVRSRSLH